MINKFRGKYRFLSNFFPAVVGIYPTAEHAYQAAKCAREVDRLAILACPTPGGAKRMGRRVLRRKDWLAQREDIMFEILHEKFSDPNLGKLLLETYPHELIEGNTWGDTYWGICNGVGKNVLGKLLMEVREMLKYEAEKASEP